MRRSILIFTLMGSTCSASDTETQSLTYDVFKDEDIQPDRVAQCGAASLTWLLCFGNIFSGLLNCCARTPEPLCPDVTQYNPSARKHIDPYAPAQEGSCHDTCFLCVPCCYKDQIQR